MQSFNLKQLAEHLGLSQTTVSRALNGFPEVSEKTRQRVREAAHAFNYRPSPSAAQLATGKARAIGHVVPLSEHRMINPHFSDFLAGASEVYAKAGFDLLIRAAQPDEEAAVYRDFAARKRVDGVVVHGPLVDDDRPALLRSIGLPFVVHGRIGARGGEAENGFSWLDVANREAFERATRRLLDLGHRRIALVNGLVQMNFAALRQCGYGDALEAAGIVSAPELVTNADMTEPYGYTATKMLLALDEPPTAILYCSILAAMGGTRAFHERGLTPGKDIAVMTFDDSLSFLEDDIATVDGQPPRFFAAMRSSIQEAGRSVAAMLLDQIAQPDAPLKQVLWDAEFVDGASMCPPRKG